MINLNNDHFISGKIFTLELDFTAGDNIVDRLVAEGGPWCYNDQGITSARFPIKGDGVLPVHFRIFSGDKIERADNSIGFCVSDVDAMFRKEHMRRASIVEALLVSAKNKQIGCNGRLLVMFIKDTCAALTVGSFVQKVDKRCLCAEPDYGYWSITDYAVLGVCED